MSLQIIKDSNGTETGVYIPIAEWKMLVKCYNILDSFVNNQSSYNLGPLSRLRTAVQELNLIKSGKLESINAKTLLDEL